MAGRSLLPITVGNPRRSWSASLLKALVYRLFMIVLTVVVAYAVTADSTASLQIGVVTNILKTGTYYAYERIWDRFRFEGGSDG
ncbi:Uncharacterized membrane protein, DUF2061 family [Halapricum desulfuricans]|uniref:Uncharacterized membrane protein, DUF2061 family n=1 Tax=Halapricum desulfuricans TaxID=2841257 RepID=A0A897NK82_9EURY|nr:DUF2061 domain-containing protein [Halapricum desulfuricans]QSG11855.1 Uncharacterized membrane protein, DUF2061 family [Halapricum desulfuricans]